MGHLRDPMDKKMEVSLRRAYEAGTAGLQPNIASTCMARNMGFWREQLRDHLEKIPGIEEALDSLLFIEKEAAYIADASVEAMRISTHTTGLVNDQKGLLAQNLGGRLCLQKQVIQHSF